MQHQNEVLQNGNKKILDKLALICAFIGTSLSPEAQIFSEVLTNSAQGVSETNPDPNQKDWAT